MREKRIQLGLVLGLLLATGLNTACQEDKAAARVSSQPAQASQTVHAPSSTSPSALAREQDDDALTASGPLVVEQQLDLIAQRDGIIVKIHADTGRHLAPGDLLVQLDDRQIRSELEATRAKTRSIEADLKSWQAEEKVLQADYERAKNMWEAGLMTREQLEHAKFKAEAQEWDIRRISELLTNSKETERGLELELEKTQIRAPFGGVVARRYVREGQSIAKAERLFWFTSEGPLRLRFTVPEKYLNRLQLGRKLVLTSPNFPEEQHTARVIEISPAVDPASGTAEAMVELVGSPGKLRTGMTVNLRLENVK